MPRKEPPFLLIGLNIIFISLSLGLAYFKPEFLIDPLPTIVIPVHEKTPCDDMNDDFSPEALIRDSGRISDKPLQKPCPGHY